MMTSTTPRIYVACLASYNAGMIHGRWIYADQEAEDILAEIESMLSESTVEDAEEYAIHDFEGFYDLQISEHEDIETISGLAQLIEQYGEAYLAYADLVGIDYATPQGFEESFIGKYESETSYAEEFIQDCYDIDSKLGFMACYFNYEAAARDLFSDSVMSSEASDGGIYVFHR